MSEIEVVAAHLANQIAGSSYVNKEDLVTMISASLAVMSPPESTTDKRVHRLQEKLGQQKRNKAFAFNKVNFEKQWWRNKARSFMDDWEVELCYEDLSKELKKSGYE